MDRIKWAEKPLLLDPLPLRHKERSSRTGRWSGVERGTQFPRRQNVVRGIPALSSPSTVFPKTSLPTAAMLAA
jgi:hypothetical protein